MIIAECCTNWADFTQAKDIISLAKDGGAGLVKFQLFDAEDDKGKPHYQWSKTHELTFDQAKTLFDFGQETGIEVFFTCFGAKYVYWCELIKVKRYKIPCDFRDEQTIGAILRTNKPVIRSVFDTRDCQHGYINLYCVPHYPTKVLEVRLPDFFQRWLTNPQTNGLESQPYCEGFSDHVVGIDVAKIALAKGAKIIEKHFSIDKLTGPDAAWSMDYEDLKELVRWDELCQSVK